MATLCVRTSLLPYCSIEWYPRHLSHETKKGSHCSCEPTGTLIGILAFLDVDGAQGSGISRRDETTSDETTTDTTDDESDSGLLSILDTSNLVPRYQQATGEPTDALNGILAFLDVNDAEGQGVSRREETTDTTDDSSILDILDLGDLLGDDSTTL